MSEPLVITLPADDESLRHEIERHLAAYAEVQTAPSSFGWNETLLIVEVVAATTGTLASVTQIVQFLLDLRDRRKQQQQPSGISVGRFGQPGVALEEADEALLRRLLTGSDQQPTADDR
jgi:hypothetical protein